MASRNPANMPSPEFLALQGAVAGRFSLVRELGRGGMGVVFLARDVALERLVAIKLLPPRLAQDDVTRERFLREARTAASLAHPHVVPIHAVEVHGHLAFFVMGYVDGETLGERVRRAGPMPPAEAMRVVLEVAWALAHAHANGIVHRDVKPDNILLESDSGRALVTDFGIAGAVHERTPADGSVLGTPQYVSPEVAQGHAGDARSDVYSLGVTAWFASTGRLPFEASNASAYLLAHVNEAAPSLAAAAPRLPHRFARAVDRCLRKSPSERWEHAEEFANAVDAARATIPALPPPVRRFLAEWESGSREALTALTATAVAVGEATGLHWFNDRYFDGATGFDMAILTWVFIILAFLTGGLAIARVAEMLAAARTLRRAGYGHAQLAVARSLDPAGEADGAEEPMHGGIDGGRSAPSQRMAGRIALGVAGTVGSIALAVSGLGDVLSLIGTAGAVVFPTFTFRSVAALLPRSRTPWWTRLLKGRLGAAVFGVAGIRLDAPLADRPIDGAEPTVLALGTSARELFHALPAAAQRMLGAGVPELIAQLERQAMALRERLDDPPTAARFAASVTALENVRLDLLRLRTGEDPSAELTEELARVRDLAAAVDRGLEARDAVERLLAPITPRPG